MRSISRIIALVMLTATLTACPDPEPTASAGQALLKVINASTSRRITEIYYWKCGTSSPGENRLVGGDVIDPNGSRIYNGISPGCYNARTKSLSLSGAVFTGETTVDLKANQTFELSIS